MPKKNVKSLSKKTITSKTQRVRAKPKSATSIKKSITPTITKKPIHSERIQTAEGWKRSQMQRFKMSNAKSKS